jgi:hypothetical protein
MLHGVLGPLEVRPALSEMIWRVKLSERDTTYFHPVLESFENALSCRMRGLPLIFVSLVELENAKRAMGLNQVVEVLVGH